MSFGVPAACTGQLFLRSDPGCPHVHAGDIVRRVLVRVLPTSHRLPAGDLDRRLCIRHSAGCVLMPLISLLAPGPEARSWRVGRFQLSALSRQQPDGRYSASLSIRSGLGRGSHDRIWRFIPVFDSAHDALRYAADQQADCLQATSGTA